MVTREKWGMLESAATQYFELSMGQVLRCSNNSYTVECIVHNTGR